MIIYNLTSTTTMSARVISVISDMMLMLKFDNNNGVSSIRRKSLYFLPWAFPHFEIFIIYFFCSLYI